MRGFISAEALWAHAVAYAADTLGELARSTERSEGWENHDD